MEGAFLYASILAFVYLLSISYGKRHFNINEISFRLILLVLGIELLVSWFFYSDNIRHFPHFMRVNSPIVFLLASAFYCYIVSKLAIKKRYITNSSVICSQKICCHTTKQTSKHNNYSSLKASTGLAKAAFIL